MVIIRANPKRFFPLLCSILILILIILAIIPGYVLPYYTSLLISIFLYIVLTVSWGTFCGPTGYISLASAAFLGIGMYVTALLGEEFPLPLVVLFGGLASFLFALLVGSASLRIRGIFFAMFTFGLGEFLRHLVSWWEVSIIGRVGRWVISADYITIYYTMLIILVMTLLTSYTIRHSRFGLALRSIGEEEEAADHIGININAVKIITFAITSFWIGATGAIIATQWGYVRPDIAFDMFYSFMPTLMALFGGIGIMYGWILGAAVFTVIAELLLTEFPYYYMLIFGIVIVSVLLFFPSGLAGAIQKWRKGGLVE